MGREGSGSLRGCEFIQQSCSLVPLASCVESGLGMPGQVTQGRHQNELLCSERHLAGTQRLTPCRLRPRRWDLSIVGTKKTNNQNRVVAPCRLGRWKASGGQNNRRAWDEGTSSCRQASSGFGKATYRR
jgi:hypothetical protein